MCSSNHKPKTQDLNKATTAHLFRKQLELTEVSLHDKISTIKTAALYESTVKKEVKCKEVDYCIRLQT